jgi:hypothetical protein
MEVDFLAMTSRTVRVAPMTGRNRQGVPQYGTDAEYPAYIARELTQTITAGGSEELSTAQVYLLAVPPNLNPEARLTMPDGTKPRILRTAVFDDDEGEYGAVIYV